MGIELKDLFLSVCLDLVLKDYKVIGSAVNGKERQNSFRNFQAVKKRRDCIYVV